MSNLTELGSKALARLGMARANALEAKTSQGADADTASVRALAAYKDFESIDAGGKVIIHTDDSTDLEAVHEYLRYQIREHKTGDPVTVQ